jgi:hypothetical protein
MTTELTPEQIGKKVGLPKADIITAMGKPTNALNHIKRRIRYYCFERQRGNWAPVKLVRYFESQKGFTGWDNFAKNWDVRKENPLEVYYRMFTIHEEWEAELRRVVPDLPIDPSYKQSQ